MPRAEILQNIQYFKEKKNTMNRLFDKCMSQYAACGNIHYLHEMQFWKIKRTEGIDKMIWLLTRQYITNNASRAPNPTVRLERLNLPSYHSVGPSLQQLLQRPPTANTQWSKPLPNWPQPSTSTDWPQPSTSSGWTGQLVSMAPPAYPSTSIATTPPPPPKQPTPLPTTTSSIAAPEQSKTPGESTIITPPFSPCSDQTTQSGFRGFSPLPIPTKFEVDSDMDTEKASDSDTPNQQKTSPMLCCLLSSPSSNQNNEPIDPVVTETTSMPAEPEQIHAEEQNIQHEPAKKQETNASQTPGEETTAGQQRTTNQGQANTTFTFTNNRVKCLYALADSMKDIAREAVKMNGYFRGAFGVPYNIGPNPTPLPNFQ